MPDLPHADYPVPKFPSLISMDDLIVVNENVLFELDRILSELDMYISAQKDVTPDNELTNHPVEMI